MATVTRMPQRQSWSPPCTCGCSHPPGTPCPPPECRPCPDPNWMSWGQQLLAWNQQIQQLKSLIAEIMAEMGGPLKTGPIQGVTDGSDAAPGQVGEWVNLVGSFTVPTTSQELLLPVGVLQPGDWDCYAHMDTSVFVSSAWFLLSPLPAGFSNQMVSMNIGVPTPSTLESHILSPMARASITVPTLIAFSLGTNTEEDGTAAGNGSMVFNARRAR